ncbi:hypothetical protein ABID42_004393 [Arcicella rosea]|uniref:hypothetical protein n=1 Tax=Arcicella rosea TaxID=502909 RepID=UPI00345C6AB6
MKELDKFYLEYGKFIINFENINFRLCYIIRNICTNHNMFSEDDKKIEILLEGLTANPLLSKFKSLFLTLDISEDKEITDLIDNFHKNFLKVIEIRNFLAHGTFFPGDPQGNLENFEVRKPKLSKKGYHQNVNIISIEALRKLNLEVKKMENFINSFNSFQGGNLSEGLRQRIYNEMKSSILGLNVSLDILNKSID